MIFRVVFSLVLLMVGYQAPAARDIADKAVRGIERQMPQVPSIPNKIKDIEQRVAIPQEALQKINNNLKLMDNAALNSLNPLANIPAKLPIVNRDGSTYLVESQVENHWRAVDKEWLLMVDQADLNRLQALDLEITETKKLDSLQMTLVKFTVSKQLNNYQDLQQLLPAHLAEQLGRNYIYDASSDMQTKPAKQTLAKVKNHLCQKPVTVGMIDTAVQTHHPAFQQASVTEKNFMPQDIEVPTGHGTAVAGLLVGQDQLKALLPKAKLFSASIFYPRNEYSQGATLLHLLEALDWLVAQDVVVINMSLTGPDNKILQAAIKQTLNQGHLIVAAAGNEGPAAPPMYPAAYPGVLAVTAVDQQQQIYRWANQGDYIDFSALGVSVKTARNDGGYGAESGTSMAAPMISARYACEFMASGDNKEKALSRLQQEAIDLGEPGKDSVFGYGLLN